MSKVYKVSFSYTVYGTTQNIEADSKKDAEKWLHDELSKNGTDGLEFKIIALDYQTHNAKEIK